MKILDIPQSGRCGTYVSYRSKFGQCRRALIVPKNTWTAARERARRDFGHWSRAWSALLTEEQRAAWNLAGPKVQSAKRLGQSGSLSGQQHFQGINRARACIGRGALLHPPEPVVFDANPIGQLVITNDDNGIRILLRVSGPITGDIMVFGQAPCSRGRSKRRNVCYLGLPPAPQNGLIDITDLYIARYGQPAPLQRLFIVTRQQKNGWEDYDQETNAIVPEKPAAQQAAAASALSLIPYMHKGCTPGALEMTKGQEVGISQGAKEETPSAEAAVETVDVGGVAGVEGNGGFQDVGGAGGAEPQESGAASDAGAATNGPARPAHAGPR